MQGWIDRDRYADSWELRNKAPAAQAGEVSPHPLQKQSFGGLSYQRPESRNRGRTQHHTKTEAAATEAGEKPEANRTERVVTIGVPRAAAHEP